MSSYLFPEKKKVQDIKNEEKGLIKLGTFGDTTEYMINLYGELLYALEPVDQVASEA